VIASDSSNDGQESTGRLPLPPNGEQQQERRRVELQREDQTDECAAECVTTSPQTANAADQQEQDEEVILSDDEVVTQGSMCEERQYQRLQQGEAAEPGKQDDAPCEEEQFQQQPGALRGLGLKKAERDEGQHRRGRVGHIPAELMVDAGVVDLALEPGPVVEQAKWLALPGEFGGSVVVREVGAHLRPALTEGHQQQVGGERGGQSGERSLLPGHPQP